MPGRDGGNGLLDVVLPAGALRERLPVDSPIGESVSAELGWIDGETAIIESASACGLALVEPEDRDPMRTTTRGVGELIWTAADRGAKTIVVGLAAPRPLTAEQAPPAASVDIRECGGRAASDGGGSLLDRVLSRLRVARSSSEPPPSGSCSPAAFSNVQPKPRAAPVPPSTVAVPPRPTTIVLARGRQRSRSARPRRASWFASDRGLPARRVRARTPTHSR